MTELREATLYHCLCRTQADLLSTSLRMTPWAQTTVWMVLQLHCEHWLLGCAFQGDSKYLMMGWGYWFSWQSPCLACTKPQV